MKKKAVVTVMGELSMPPGSKIEITEDGRVVVEGVHITPNEDSE